MAEKHSNSDASIEVDDKRALAMLRRTNRAMRDSAMLAVSDVLWEFHGHVAKRQFVGYPGPGREHPHPAGKLYARSGRLRGSLEVVGPKVVGLDVRGSAVISGKQAKLQEFGGTVTPKRGKMLTIPMPAALTPSGVLRAKYRIVPADVWRTAEGRRTFILRSKRGNAFVAIREGKSDKVKLLYLLRPRVKIPARLGFFSTWRALEARRTRTLKQMLGRGLRDAKPPGGGAHSSGGAA